MARRTDVEKKVFSMKIRPLRKDWLLVLLDEMPRELIRSSGMVLSGDVVKQRNDRSATVISVGSFVEEHVQELCPGARVMLSKVYGNQIPHEDSDACSLKIVSHDQIDAILTGEAEADDYDHYVFDDVPMVEPRKSLIIIP